MDVVTIAAAAVAGLLPVLGSVADGAATKVGEKAVETGGQLLNWIRTRGRRATVDALERLEAAPEDATVRQELEAALVRQLEDAPPEAAELQTILQNGHTVVIDNTGAINNQGGTMTGVMTNSSGSRIHIGS
jgi:hypothetical protein